ncbi:MAG: hypothetical protein AAGK66_01660 [Pseudomonadota bacterium]
MPSLLFHIDGGNWVASVANTDVQYQFEGDTLSEQAESLSCLGTDLEGGTASISDAVSVALDIPDGVEIADVVDELFATTDLLMYGDSIIYGAVGAEMLIDTMEEVGTAILAVLGA